MVFNICIIIIEYCIGLYIYCDTAACSTAGAAAANIVANKRNSFGCAGCVMNGNYWDHPPVTFKETRVYL